MSGKLITNQETTLSHIINATLPKCKDICFLVGYFYFSGFAELYKQIGDKKLRVLVGLDIDVDAMNVVKEYERFNYKWTSKRKNQEEYYKQFVKLFNNTDFFDSAEKLESFRLFYDKIKNGTLEIRKTSEPNHAKMYLFEAEDSSDPTLPGHMVVGSSNLSYQGLKNRNELNVVFHDADYNDGKKLFDELWKSAATLADKDTIADFENKVIKEIWFDKLPTPYAIYIRVLDEYFRINYQDGRFKSPRALNKKYMDFEYQTDAIKEGLDRIERHNGVIIADVVGLGKSIIASTIASNLGLPVVIIAPPHLEKQWNDYSHEFGFWDLAHIYTSGRIDKAVQEYASYDKQILVIIDEAHKYRNPKNNDYIGLHQLCQGNKVLLLTATPYNNKPQDIYSLLKLFQIPGKSTLKNIDNLGAQFDDLIAKYNKAEKEAKKSDDGLEKFNEFAKEIAKKILNIISPVIIRRSRKDLESISRYKEDLKKQGVSFPKMGDPKPLEYNLGKTGDLYLRTLNAIYAKDMIDEEEQKDVYKAARYQPLQYVKQERRGKVAKQIEEEGIEFDLFQRSQKNLANFMRRLLVHRFESSVNAFKISLERMIESSKIILHWIDVYGKIPVFKRGMLPNIDEVIESSDDTGADLFGATEFDRERDGLKEKGLFELEVSDMLPEFEQDIRMDVEILESIHNDWFGKDNKINTDPKLDDFVNKIKDMLEKEPERKIIVFSEYADTIEYLYEKLLEKNLPVFGYSSRKATDTKKRTIRTNFDAGVSPEDQRNDYKILVATDAISEGYNLHRAGTIFNYDIPYNPTRVIQRIGRINRVNKKVFDELYIYNYFPSLIGEKDVKVKRISTIKMRMIHAIMGGDTKILTGDEELFFSAFNKKFRDAENTSDQKSWDTDFREEWEQAKGSAEYNNALAIRQRSRTGRSEKRGKNGVIVFGKRGNECVFKWALDTESAPTALLPEEALPLFKADKTELPAKVSVEFEGLYQLIKKRLFGNSADTPQTMLSKAKNKIIGWQNNDENKPYKEYLDLLWNVVELDALPDYSLITKAKTCNDLKKKIDFPYLEKILEAAKRIDSEPGNVILAEELV
jgi:superfamily II DNA or RNA helicase